MVRAMTTTSCFTIKATPGVASFSHSCVGRQAESSVGMVDPITNNESYYIKGCWLNVKTLNGFCRRNADHKKGKSGMKISMSLYNIHTVRRCGLLCKNRKLFSISLNLIFLSLVRQNMGVVKTSLWDLVNWDIQYVLYLSLFSHNAIKQLLK